jgi:signal transduction histidine kinase
VLKLWREHDSMQEDPMLTEIARFNEAVDQVLAESIATYSDEVTHSRDTFLAILGHDLRNPLSAVSMSAHQLASSGRVVPEGSESIFRSRLWRTTWGRSAKLLTTRFKRRIPNACSISRWRATCVPADPVSTSLGFGLFIAKEIVTGNGGTLEVESSSHEGTVFRVKLPRNLDNGGKEIASAPAHDIRIG